MASGFVMDALHSCNDEWVRIVKNEWSVGGGNIHWACHGQRRKHRGLPASRMERTSRLHGQGSYLFIYFSPDTFSLGRQKCEIDSFSWMQEADCGCAAELSYNLLPNVWVPLGFPQRFYGPVSKFSVNSGQQCLHPLPHQSKIRLCFRVM